MTGHPPDEVEDVGLVALPQFHTVPHGLDDVVGLVLRPVLRALLRCPCITMATQ